MIDLQVSTVSDFLHLELRKRCEKNGAYSLRAFARDLDMSPSRLCEVLKYNEGLSTARAGTLAQKLKLRSREREFWMNLNLAQHGRSPKSRELAKKRLVELRHAEKIKQIREDQFQVISEWYHGALMELPQIKGFEDNPNWMAARLGISVDQVEAGIEKLLKLQLLAKDENGQLISPTVASGVMTEIPSAAIRKAHRQLLERASDSLLNVPMNAREFNSMIIAIPDLEMPRFRREIQQFMNTFYREIGSEEKTAVYALAIQFFPLQKNPVPQGKR